MNSHKRINLPYFEFTEFQAFLLLFSMQMFVEMFSEVITVFSQLGETFLLTCCGHLNCIKVLKCF